MPVKSIDEKKLNLIDASEVPPGRIRVTRWQVIFDEIPAGKAWVVTEKEISFTAVRCSLYELQRKGQFKNLAARKVKEPDGSYRLYVINTTEVKQKKLAV